MHAKKRAGMGKQRAMPFARKSPHEVAELVEKNTGLAFKIAKGYWENNHNQYLFRRLGLFQLMDVRQEALGSLHRAANDFQAGMGCRFTTLGGTYVKNHLKQMLTYARAQKRSADPIETGDLQEILGTNLRNVTRTLKEKERSIKARRKPAESRGKSSGLLVENTEKVLKIKKIIATRVKRMKGFSDSSKRIFIERFGLDGEKPKSVKELHRIHRVSLQSIYAVTLRIRARLIGHSKIRTLLEAYDTLP